MLDRSLLCNAKWEQVQAELEAHPEFDNYFQPLGRSLDRLSSSGIGSCSSSSSHSHQYWDDRIPGEVLAKPEAQHLFHELQKELIDEISLERQADKFRNLLAQKEAVTPGKSFKDAKVMVEEIAAYEKALPPDSAYRIYATFQEELKQQARRNFNELLLENLEVFVDIVVDWRLQYSDLPMLGLNEKENNLVHELLCQDKRYRDMNGLSDDRQTAIGQFASFVCLPLERHCPAGNLCADLVLPIAIDNHGHDQNKFLSIDVAVHGQADLVDEFIAAIKKLIAPEKVFRYNGCSVRLNAFPASSAKGPPQLSTDNLLLQSSRVPTTIYLLDSSSGLAEDIHYEHLHKRHHRWLPPMFVQVCEPAKLDMLPPQMGLKLAEKFHGVFVGAGPSSAIRSSANRRSGSSTASSMVNNLRDRFNTDNPATDLSPHFRCELLTKVLREVCSGQLDSGYCDLRVRLSLFCGDSFPPESILMPFLDHSTRSDPSGRTFSLDMQLEENKEHNIRVSVNASSYHNWLLSRWPLNSFQGHILVYSCVRKASWRHAKTAARLLINSLDEGSEERLVMAKSIMLVAVNEPTAFFTSNEANQLLTKGCKLAEELGCGFNTVSPTRNSSAQVHTYIQFFQQLYSNPLLPSDYFTISPRHPRSPSYISNNTFTSSSSQQHRVQRQPSYAYTKGSTLTGSANTLLSNYDSTTCSRAEETHYAVVDLPTAATRPSTASYCSGCCHLSTTGSIGRRVSEDMPQHTNPVTDTCSLCEQSTSGKGAGSVKERLKESNTARSVDGTGRGSGGRPQSAVFSHASLSFGGERHEGDLMTGSEHSAATPPSSVKAQRRLDKIISSFIQLKSTDEDQQRPIPTKSITNNLQRHNSIDKMTPQEVLQPFPNP